MNILVSFAYLQKSKLMVERLRALAGAGHKILLDSGGFTAYQTGRQIDLADYIRFLKEGQGFLWRYFTLDAIGDHEATLRNTATIRAAGLEPIPIFTPGDSIGALERYLAESEVVGIGGLVKRSRPQVVHHLNAIHSVTEGRKLHLLGVGSLPILRVFRPYMADSSGWKSALINRRVSLYYKGTFLKFGKEDFVNKPTKELAKAMDTYGIPASVFSKNDAWVRCTGYNPRLVLGAASYLRFSQWAQEALGVTYFLASSSIYDLNSLAYADDILSGRDTYTAEGPQQNRRKK